MGQKTNDSIPKRNTIYFEALGQGNWYSVSYARSYRIHHKIQTSLSAGLEIIQTKHYYSLFTPTKQPAFASPEDKAITIIGLPISYSFLFGKKNSFLELGIGFTLLRWSQFWIWPNIANVYSEEWDYGYETDYYSFITPIIGYRFQRSKGGFFFRANFTPMIAFINRIENNVGYLHSSPYYEYFSNVAGTGHKISPWGGISIGYTFGK